MADRFDSADLDAESRCRSQGSGTVLAASKAGEGSPTSAERIGAYTGLPLPKHRPRNASRKTDTQFDADLPPGPRIAPLAPGLPNTPIEACKLLMLAIVVQALQDNDLRYVLSPMFEHDLMCVGLEADEAFQVKIAYLRGQVDPHRLGVARL